jgi:O-antigen/teichoic acid export membrane protein
MKLLKAFGIYTISTFLKSSIPFLLLPIITKYLSPEDFGIANFYQVVLRLISGIIMLGVPACCTIFYFKHDRKEYPSLVLNSIISPVTLTIVLFILSAIFIKYITPIFELNYLWVLFIAPIAFLYLIPEITYTTLRNEEKPILFSTFNLSQILLHFGITTILIVVFKFNWLGILLGVLLSLIIINLSSLRYLLRNNFIGGEYDRQKVKYAVYIGAPLILHRIGGILINKSDALFISEMLGKDILGIYMVGYQIGMVVLLFQEAIGHAWRPYVFKKLNNGLESDKFKIVKQSYILMSIYLLFPVIIYFLSPYIFKFFIDIRYHDSIIIAPLIALGYSFLGMYKLVTIYIFYMKKTGILSTFTLANGLLNIVFNYIFIRIFGVIGAAYATILSMFLIFIISLIISNNIFPMPWNPVKLFRNREPGT